MTPDKCPLGKPFDLQICYYCNFGDVNFYFKKDLANICKCPEKMNFEIYSALVKEYVKKEYPKMSRENFWEFVKTNFTPSAS